MSDTAIETYEDDDVFTDEIETEDEAEQVEQEPESEAEEDVEEEVEGEESEEEEQESSEDEEQSAPPAEETTESKLEQLEKEIQAFKAQALDERRKRQELEATRQNQMFQDDIPDPQTNPQGYERYMAENQRAIGLKISISRQMMADSVENFEEKEAHFTQLAQSNPELTRQMMASPNPAKFAIDIAEKSMRLQQFQDPNYEQNLRERIRQELQKEMSEKPTSPKREQALKVPNLTTATSKGKNTEVVEDEDMFEDSPF